MRRRIHTQGDFDGACLPYAIANAFTALTHCQPELASWDNGIRAIPYALDFLQGCVGTTQHHEKNPALLHETVTALLTAISDSKVCLSTDPCPDVVDLQSVARLVDSRSVAVFWYRGQTQYVEAGDHWVCAVAADDDPLRVHVACSIRRSDDGRFNDRQYTERHHTDTNRYSNDWITEEHKTEIMRGAVFRLSIPEPNVVGDARRRD